ncbi:Na+/H+ antiporter subunit C [Halotalea alkalilenta]|uniref:Na+/H+ antiporter subunit C n=1 Tax=Halotalea alkalilenta TaxID=376489 RepID=UPI000694DDE0|nr:Na+/H+ antiporter subunit C [Halotalea alkalilenta]
MEALFSAAVGILTTCGIYLTLRGRTFPVVLGLTLLTYAANLFLFSMGRLKLGASNLVNDGLPDVDPLPQALVLTAIVIGFAMTAFVIILAIRARGDLGSDHVNGRRRQSRRSKHDDPLELNQARGGIKR